MKLTNTSKTNFPIYCWFIQFVIVLSLTSLVIWQSLIPKSPILAIRDILILTSLGQNSTLQHESLLCNTSLIFNLEITNPNKGIGIYYDNINMILFRSNLVVGTKSMPAFYQGHKKVTSLEVLVNADQKHCKGIPSGNIDLRVAAKTAIVYEYRIFRWKTKHRQMGFEGYMTLSPNGTSSGNNTELHKTMKQI